MKQFLFVPNAVQNETDTYLSMNQHNLNSGASKSMSLFPPHTDGMCESRGTG